MKEAELYPLTVSTMWADVGSARRALLDCEGGQDQLGLGLPNVTTATKVLDRHSPIRRAVRLKTYECPRSSQTTWILATLAANR